MKALIQTNYGSAEELIVSQVNKPQPRDHQVLINVKATSLNAPDWRLLAGKPVLTRLFSGLTKPKNKIKGTDFSGVVSEVGKCVKTFKIGDQVYGDLADSGFGAFAEYVAVDASLVQFKPCNLSHLEAAALPLTAGTALQAIQKADIVKGCHVLIVGAAGGVGSYALQIAKVYGAVVTAVVSSKQIEQAKSLGANKTIDFTSQHLNHHRQQYDVIIAINGHYPLREYAKLMNKNGRLIVVGGKSVLQLMTVAVFAPLLSIIYQRTFISLLAKQSAAGLQTIRELTESQKLVPVIYKEIAFEAIPDGLVELMKGQADGKIVAHILEDNNNH